MKRLVLFLALCIPFTLLSMEGGSVPLAKEDFNAPHYFQFLAQHASEKEIALGNPIAINPQLITVSEALKKACSRGVGTQDDPHTFLFEMNFCNNNGPEKLTITVKDFFEKIVQATQEIDNKNQNIVLKRFARRINNQDYCNFFNLLCIPGYAVYLSNSQDPFYIQTPENKDFFIPIFGTKDKPTSVKDCIESLNIELEKNNPCIAQDFLLMLAGRVLNNAHLVDKDSFNRLIKNYLERKINLMGTIAALRIEDQQKKKSKISHLQSLISEENICKNETNVIFDNWKMLLLMSPSPSGSKDFLLYKDILDNDDPLYFYLCVKYFNYYRPLPDCIKTDQDAIKWFNIAKKEIPHFPLNTQLSFEAISIALEQLENSININPRYFQFQTTARNALGKPIKVSSKAIALSALLSSLQEKGTKKNPCLLPIRLRPHNDTTVEKMNIALEYFFKKFEKVAQKIDGKNKDEILRKFLRRLRDNTDHHNRLTDYHNLLFNTLRIQGCKLVCSRLTDKHHTPPHLKTPENKDLLLHIFGNENNPVSLDDSVKRLNGELEKEMQNKGIRNIGQDSLWLLVAKIVNQFSDFPILLQNSDINRDAFNLLVANYEKRNINLRQAIACAYQVIKKNPVDTTQRINRILSSENKKNLSTLNNRFDKNKILLLIPTPNVKELLLFKDISDCYKSSNYYYQIDEEKVRLPRTIKTDQDAVQWIEDNYIKLLFFSDKSLAESMKLLDEEFKKGGIPNLALHSLRPLRTKIIETYPETSNGKALKSFNVPKDFNKEIFNNLITWYFNRNINFVEAFRNFPPAYPTPYLPGWMEKIISPENQSRLLYTKNIFYNKTIFLLLCAPSSLKLYKDIFATKPVYYYDTSNFRKKPLPDHIQADEAAIKWVTTLNDEIQASSWASARSRTEKKDLLKQLEKKATDIFDKINAISSPEKSLEESMRLLNKEFEKGDTLYLAQHALQPLIDKIIQTYPETSNDKVSKNFNAEIFNELVKGYLKYRINFMQALLAATRNLSWIETILSPQNREDLAQIKNMFKDKMILVALDVPFESAQLTLYKVASIPHFYSYYYHFQSSGWNFISNLPEHIKTDEKAVAWIRLREAVAIKRSYAKDDQNGRPVLLQQVMTEVCRTPESELT